MASSHGGGVQNPNPEVAPRSLPMVGLNLATSQLSGTFRPHRIQSSRPKPDVGRLDILRTVSRWTPTDLATSLMG